jgi:hypothetical protein
MSDINREEIQAKLDLVEARTEKRFVEVSGKLDRVQDSISAFSQTVTKEFIRAHNEIAEVKGDNKNTRWTVTGVVVASILAALAGLWVTQGNLLSAFQSGLSAVNSPAPQTAPTTKRDPAQSPR